MTGRVQNLGLGDKGCRIMDKGPKKRRSLSVSNAKKVVGSSAGHESGGSGDAAARAGAEHHSIFLSNVGDTAGTSGPVGADVQQSDEAPSSQVRYIRLANLLNFFAVAC